MYIYIYIYIGQGGNHPMICFGFKHRFLVVLFASFCPAAPDVSMFTNKGSRTSKSWLASGASS